MSDFIKSLENRITGQPQQREVMPLLEWHRRYRRFDNQLPEIPHVLEGLYKDTHSEIVVLKAAQVGISEWGISQALWCADQRWAGRGVALYVFPKQDQMDDFSQARFGKAIDDSWYLKERASTSAVNRTRLRRIGSATIYFRGSDSVAQTRAIDADMVIADEVDLFRQGALDRVKERLGSSIAPLFRAFSQPQFPDGPIDLLWKQSDQRHYLLTCSRCTHEQYLTWDENIEFNTDLTDVRVICRRCRRSLDRLAKGRWVPAKSQANIHGYHVSKLYSPRANLLEMLHKSLSVEDPFRVQSFYNADLGLPYRPAGSPALKDFHQGSYAYDTLREECYLGVDVGHLLHYVVIGRNFSDEPFCLLKAGSVSEFPGLDEVWAIYRPKLAVIDARGDPRATLEWAQRHFGRVYRWEHRPSALDPEYRDDLVFLHRTALLDRLFGALKTGQVILHPMAGSEFFSHLSANVREIVTRNGRAEARYIPTKPDHYAFALAFAIIASGRVSAVTRIAPIDKMTSETSPLLAVEASGKWNRWRSGSRW